MYYSSFRELFPWGWFCKMPPCCSVSLCNFTTSGRIIWNIFKTHQVKTECWSRFGNTVKFILLKNWTQLQTCTRQEELKEVKRPQSPQQVCFQETQSHSNHPESCCWGTKFVGNQQTCHKENRGSSEFRCLLEGQDNFHKFTFLQTLFLRFASFPFHQYWL